MTVGSNEAHVDGKTDHLDGRTAHLGGKMTESTWESLALAELAHLDWEIKPGKDLVPGTGHRRDWDDLILHDELRQPSNG